MMGIIDIEGFVRGDIGENKSVRFFLDSGIQYTVLPYPVWRSIGLVPKRSATLTLADGTPIERQISECYIVLPEGEGHTPVILGQPGDEAILGVVTLEILGLVLNPFTRTLQPMRMMLA